MINLFTYQERYLFQSRLCLKTTLSPAAPGKPLAPSGPLSPCQTKQHFSQKIHGRSTHKKEDENL